MVIASNAARSPRAWTEVSTRLNSSVSGAIRASTCSASTWSSVTYLKAIHSAGFYRSTTLHADDGRKGGAAGGLTRRCPAERGRVRVAGLDITGGTDG